MLIFMEGKQKLCNVMDKISKRLEKLTHDVLMCSSPTSDEGKALMDEIGMLQELSKTWKVFEALTVPVPSDIKVRLDVLTKEILKLRRPVSEEIAAFLDEVKTVRTLLDMWTGYSKVDVKLNEDLKEEDRRSSREWDTDEFSLSTSIKLTEKQREAMGLLDNDRIDKALLLGGSGSGKSFIEAYKIIRDVLRYRAPCLIARDKMVDLTQGMIDQIVPTILQLIASANGQDNYKTWMIDGLKFAKWSDKHSKLEFATGGYIRFAGLSARDLSESGSDKILSPSWLHVMLEEVSELEYETVEKVITRLRYNVPGVVNKLLLCENPPSINHWTYKRFYERESLNGGKLSYEEYSQMGYLLMNPKDNVENLGEKYIRNLSQMTGANRERFYEGKFQDSETGEILKKMQWTDNLPPAYDYDAIIIYVDPTPLTTREHSVYADFKAAVLCGLWQGITFCLDIRLVRGSTMDMLQSIKQLYDASPDKRKTEIWMENKAVPSDFKQVWGTFSNLTSWFVPINMDKRHFGDKKQAIETFLQPIFDTEMIYFNAAWRNTERGKQAEHQILKFSRKANKFVHDDIPDALMKADTKLRGKQGKLKKRGTATFNLVMPAFIRKGG